MWGAYAIHTGPNILPIISSTVTFFAFFALGLAAVFYRNKEARTPRRGYRMHRKKNWLFSNWKRRMVNIVKGKSFKRERRFASYTAHYFVVNAILGFYAYFLVNPTTIIFNLLIITICIYILVLLHTALNSYIGFISAPKIEEEHSLKLSRVEVILEVEGFPYEKGVRMVLVTFKWWLIIREFINFLVRLMTSILVSICPKNVHPLMTFILVPVELISILIRPISLAVRMFANLVMGHIMISGYNFATAYSCGGWWGWYCATTVGSIYLYVFELIVLFLQSAIFLYLVTTYFWGTNEIH